MKKYLVLLLAICTLSSAILCGCSNMAEKEVTSNESVSTSVKTIGKSENTPKMMQEILKMSDTDFSDFFGNMDICLGDEFNFTDAKNLSSKELFSFFSYITQTNAYPENYLQQFSAGSENTFEFPKSEIQNVLDKYLEGANFDTSKLPDYLTYDSATGKVKATIMGVGGARFPRVSIKEIVANDTMRATVDFYSDNNYEEVQFTKIYTIKYSDDGFKLLSIEQK